MIDMSIKKGNQQQITKAKAFAKILIENHKLLD